MKRNRRGSDQDGHDYHSPLQPASNAVYDSFLADDPLIGSDELADESDYDSLFDADDDASLSCQRINSTKDTPQYRGKRPACRSVPSIRGLYLDSSVLIPHDIEKQLWKNCMETFFSKGDVNQVMLFERARSFRSTEPDTLSGDTEKIRQTGLPKFLLDLLDVLKGLLKDVVPPDVHSLLFPNDDKSHQARQVILNHYRPGEGITPHVDLLNRYGDGIIGVSLHSGTVMDFTKVSDSSGQTLLTTDRADGVVCRPTMKDDSVSLNGFVISMSGAPKDDQSTFDQSESYGVYLPERSIFVLSGEARYNWTHGISKRTVDFVESSDGNSVELLPRGERLSITFRWLLPGADVVGD